LLFSSFSRIFFADNLCRSAMIGSLKIVILTGRDREGKQNPNRPAQAICNRFATTGTQAAPFMFPAEPERRGGSSNDGGEPLQTRAQRLASRSTPNRFLL
jgi:hypothetical protein